MAKHHLGLRQVRALKPGEIAWDPSLPGFGARRQRGESVSYVLSYRTQEGRQRWFTIGRHGAPWTPSTARAKAMMLLAEVADGADPSGDKQAERKAATVSQLCDYYLADAEAGRLLTRRKVAKKASTLSIDRGRIARHIKPLLGALKVASVTREDVDRFMHDVAAGRTAATVKTANRGLARVRGGKGTASRTVGLLGAIFGYAVRRRMRDDNPVRGVLRFADGRCERRLSEGEYRALGGALRVAEVVGIWPPAVAAARFLVLAGWRSGEALGLRWRDLDLGRRTAILPDTKTGRSVRPLSRAVCDLLQGLTRNGEGDLVFPPTRGSRTMKGFGHQFGKIAALGELPRDVTPHVMRHSFASLAADLGYGEPTIATLIGHKGQTMTSRYVHTADAVLLAAADAVANRTTELMGDTRTDAQVIPLRREA